MITPKHEEMAKVAIIVPESLDRILEHEVADRRCQKKQLIEHLIRLGLKAIKPTDLCKVKHP